MDKKDVDNVRKKILEINQDKCCSEQYGLCKNCKYQKFKHQKHLLDSALCISCTLIVDTVPTFYLNGVQMNGGLTWLHTNFEPKENEND